MKTYKPCRYGMYLCEAFAVCLMAAGIFLSARLLVRYPIIMYTSIGVCVFSALFAALIFLPVSFSKESYRLSDKAVTRLSGFWFEKTRQMAFRSVQYVTVVKLPFSRYTAGSFVILHSAGGRLWMRFLYPDDADEIACFLNNAITRQGENL